jgi:hypothetical protein
MVVRVTTTFPVAPLKYTRTSTRRHVGIPLTVGQLAEQTELPRQSVGVAKSWTMTSRSKPVIDGLLGQPRRAGVEAGIRDGEHARRNRGGEAHDRDRQEQQRDHQFNERDPSLVHPTRRSGAPAPAR